MNTEPLRRMAKLLRALHADGTLVLPNAWDAASARAVEAAGFPVVATSSGAVTASLGYEDGNSMPVDEAFAAIRRVASAVGVPVTADLEGGYGLPAAELVDRLLGAGAVGCNLEDTDHVGGGLVDAGPQAEFLAAVKAAGRAAGVDVVVNARVDSFRTANNEHAAAMPGAIERARAYVEAGADCIFPIRLADDGLIAEFVAAVAAPVNVMVTPSTPPYARLQELSVARASLASGLFRVAQDAVRAHLDGLR